MKSVKKVF